MNRALPASFAFHALALLLIVLFGTWVDRPVLMPKRVINVQFAQLPEPVVQEERTEAEPEPEPEQAEPEPPAPVPEQAEAEPEIVPEARPEETIVEPEPEPVEEVREQAPPPVTTDEPAAETVSTAEATDITATDSEVPSQFQYYLGILKTKVTRQWQPKRLGMRGGSERFCRVHFFVERDGRITRETLVQSSGVELFDREALNSVRRAGRMPPLPAGIKGTALGVTYTFTLKTGI